MIRVFHPGSGSRIWILTFYLSQIPILDPRSRIQGSKRHRIPDPKSWIWIRNTGDFWFPQVTFNGRCCLNDSFNGSGLRSFYVQKRILRIFCFDITSLMFTIFKLRCPAHLFPNTPRTLLNPIPSCTFLKPWFLFLWSAMSLCICLCMASSKLPSYNDWID